MRLATRGVSLLLAALLLANCGGDSNEPEDPFPDAAGIYEVGGGFDDLPSSQASFEGTLELTQASRESGTLQGSASLLVELAGDVFNITDDVLSGATVSPGGVISFTMAGGSSTWTFTGTLSGNNITQGRHTLAGGEDNFSGDWFATRVTGSSARAALRTTAGATSLDLLRQQLAR